MSPSSMRSVEHDSSSPTPEDRAEPLVVVIDDDPSFRKAVSRLIRLWGFRTWTFASAEEYLRIGVPSDCIVLDLHLDGMSGLELQYLLVAKGNPPPIIFVTAMDDPVVRRQALEGGAVACLDKPIDDYRLQEILQAVTATPFD